MSKTYLAMNFLVWCLVLGGLGYEFPVTDFRVTPGCEVEECALEMATYTLFESCAAALSVNCEVEALLHVTLPDAPSVTACESKACAVDLEVWQRNIKNKPASATIHIEGYADYTYTPVDKHNADDIVATELTQVSNITADLIEDNNNNNKLNPTEHNNNKFYLTEDNKFKYGPGCEHTDVDMDKFLYDANRQIVGASTPLGKLLENDKVIVTIDGASCIDFRFTSASTPVRISSWGKSQVESAWAMFAPAALGLYMFSI